jgi:type IV secretory pathway component VirB8
MSKKEPQDSSNSEEQTKEYYDFIKATVADKSYFNDAFDWYCFRYVTPICDRTLLIFGSVVAAVVLFFLINMIQGTFPLVEKVPIIVNSKDQSKYFSNLVDLKPKKDFPGYDPNITTVDEAIAKYLVSLYIKNREGFDFSKAEVDDVNRKFIYVKNSSSDNEFRAFQLLMDKDNPDSPINYFGQDVKKTIKIFSFRFIKKESGDFSQKARDFFVKKIPNQAEVRFTAETRVFYAEEGYKVEKQNYLAKIDFAFNGVKRPEDGGRPDIRLIVNNYKLFKVQ